ncbi:MAG: thymidine phosphorylase [Gemmatimonadaceae bacterium]|nr:thymidine phosphorylase [Gemmatimonadaceae bacterium]
MHLIDLITRKRDGGRLTPGELRTFATEYAAGRYPDYQVSALLMAIFFRGLDDEEGFALMEAMLASGGRLDFTGLGKPVVDKHSTGGVGDKVSIPLAPLVAACGVAVPMMSGRGLGHTGGTLDKLEAIPGFNTRLSLAEAKAQVERIGCALIGQTGEIAPADKKLYALRDATATVEAIPLIAASIMSKKLAEGLTGLVLDVKTGSGAFMPEMDRAITLARTMVAIGERCGVPTVALLTSMEHPLGVACGNALEIEESIEILRGGGPIDTRELTLALGAEMLVLAKLVPDRGAARVVLEARLADGSALAKFREIVVAQGGDPRVVDEPSAVLPRAAAQAVVTAQRAGVVQQVAPRVIGRGIIGLGGGRHTMEDTVDPSVGFHILVRPGQRTTRGQPLAAIFARDAAGIDAGKACIAEAIIIGDDEFTPPKLVSHRVTSAGVDAL